MRIAKTIILTDEERITLMQWSRGRKTPARLVLRAKIVLAAAAGQENKDIAAELNCTRRTAGTWRSRFSEGRLEAIVKDAPRSGRTPSVRADKEAEILRKTTQENRRTRHNGRFAVWPVLLVSAKTRFSESGRTMG